MAPIVTLIAQGILLSEAIWFRSLDCIFDTSDHVHIEQGSITISDDWFFVLNYIHSEIKQCG